MFKLLILLVLATVVFLQTVPAYCEGGRIVTLQVSATLPEHAMLNANHELSPFSNNLYQIVQTQTVIRNNKSISLTSIVVP